MFVLSQMYSYCKIARSGMISRLVSIENKGDVPKLHVSGVVEDLSPPVPGTPVPNLSRSGAAKPTDLCKLLVCAKMTLQNVDLVESAEVVVFYVKTKFFVELHLNIDFSRSFV